MQPIQSPDNLFHDGSASSGQLGTIVTAAWLNAVQSEVLAVIRAGGLTPSGNNNEQMLAALQAMLNGVAMPAGAVAHFARTTAPTGWLKANGAAVSRTTYAILFAAIGTTFGAGDGSTTFNLPDLRSEFLRGLDDGRGVDIGRALGSWQDGQNLSHSHTGGTDTVGNHTHANGAYTRLMRPPYGGSLTGSDYDGSGSEQAVGPGDSADMLAAGGHSHTVTINSSGGSEARPRNVALLACIKC